MEENDVWPGVGHMREGAHASSRNFMRRCALSESNKREKEWRTLQS